MAVPPRSLRRRSPIIKRLGKAGVAGVIPKPLALEVEVPGSMNRDAHGDSHAAGTHLDKICRNVPRRPIDRERPSGRELPQPQG